MFPALVPRPAAVYVQILMCWSEFLQICIIADVYSGHCMQLPAPGLPVLVQWDGTDPTAQSVSYGLVSTGHSHENEPLECKTSI